MALAGSGGSGDGTGAATVGCGAGAERGGGVEGCEADLEPDLAAAQDGLRAEATTARQDRTTVIDDPADLASASVPGPFDS